MSSIEVSDDVAAALAAVAEARGVTIPELIAELVDRASQPEGLDGFVGCMDSGDPDWAATDTTVLRTQAAARAG